MPSKKILVIVLFVLSFCASYSKEKPIDIYRNGYDALSSGKDSIALSNFEKIVSLQKSGQVAADSTFITTLKIMSSLYKDKQKSLSTLDYAIKLQPKNYEFYLYKAFIYSSLNDKAKTIENLNIIYKHKSLLPTNFQLKLPLEYQQFMQWWNDPEFIDAVQNMLK